MTACSNQPDQNISNNNQTTMKHINVYNINMNKIHVFLKLLRYCEDRYHSLILNTKMTIHIFPQGQQVKRLTNKTKFIIQLLIVMSIETQISYYLRSAENINKKVGGSHPCNQLQYQRTQGTSSGSGSGNCQGKEGIREMENIGNRVGQQSRDGTQVKHVLSSTPMTPQAPIRQLLISPSAPSLGSPYAKPSQVQMTAMQRWEARSRQEDQKLGVLGDLTSAWKNRMLKTGALVDQQTCQIQGVIREVDMVNSSFLHSNQKLKNIITTYRKPGKFCIDVFLGLLLIGLLAGIVGVATK